MKKKKLFKIMNKADASVIAMMSDKIQKEFPVVVVKEPGKTLAMVKMKEPVNDSKFYIGEVMVCEAAVEIDGTKGFAVAMGDDFQKTLNMAIIDAACNKGVFKDYDLLHRLEEEQTLLEQKENAMHLKTMVSFNSMDQEVPGDVQSFKKA